MQKSLLVAGMFALVFTMSGCGSSADGLMNDMIRCMNEMADALESKAPQEKITEIRTRLEDINNKVKALNLTDDEKKKLMEKHMAGIEKAGKRVMEASMKNVGGMLPGMPTLPKSGNTP